MKRSHGIKDEDATVLLDLTPTPVRYGLAMKEAVLLWLQIMRSNLEGAGLGGSESMAPQKSC